MTILLVLFVVLLAWAISWWNVKRTNKHSKKPEFFQDLIETVSDAPRLEMFARRERDNWDVWGNEVESSVAL